MSDAELGCGEPVRNDPSLTLQPSVRGSICQRLPPALRSTLERKGKQISRAGGHTRAKSVDARVGLPELTSLSIAF